MKVASIDADLPQRECAVDDVRNREPEVRHVGGQSHRLGKVGQGSEHPRIGTVMLGNENIVGFGEIELPVGGPSSIMADDLRQLTGRTGWDRDRPVRRIQSPY
jgi:hypothetical protein